MEEHSFECNCQEEYDEKEGYWKRMLSLVDAIHFLYLYWESHFHTKSKKVQQMLDSLSALLRCVKYQIEYLRLTTESLEDMDTYFQHIFASICHYDKYLRLCSEGQDSSIPHTRSVVSFCVASEGVITVLRADRGDKIRLRCFACNYVRLSSAFGESRARFLLQSLDS